METQTPEQWSRAIRSVSPTDLVYFIIGLTFIKHKMPSIARDAIYEGFEALSKKHPIEFSNFYFVPRGGIHHSNEIEDILFRLGGVMSVANPRYQNMEFPIGSLPVVEQRFKKLIPEETARKIIDKLVDEFFVAIETTGTKK